MGNNKLEKLTSKEMVDFFKTHCYSRLQIEQMINAIPRPDISRKEVYTKYEVNELMNEKIEKMKEKNQLAETEIHKWDIVGIIFFFIGCITILLGVYFLLPLSWALIVDGIIIVVISFTVLGVHNE